MDNAIERKNDTPLYGYVAERCSNQDANQGFFRCIVETRNGERYGITHKPSSEGFYLNHTLKFYPGEGSVYVLGESVPEVINATLVETEIDLKDAPLIKCQVIEKAGATRTLHFGDREERYKDTQLKIPQRLFIGNLVSGSIEPYVGTHVKIATKTVRRISRLGKPYTQAQVYHIEMDKELFNKSIKDTRTNIAPEYLVSKFVPDLCVGSFDTKVRCPVFNEYDYAMLTGTGNMVVVFL